MMPHYENVSLAELIISISSMKNMKMTCLLIQAQEIIVIFKKQLLTY